MKDLKNFDWRRLKKYLDPEAANDLNAFLEKLPQRVGQAALIAAGVAWASAGAFGLFAAVQLQNLTVLRAELQDAKAVNPPVPKIRNVPVDRASVESFAEDAKQIYRGVDVKADGAQITIAAKSTASFPEFREAMGHIQNGGKGWRVNVERLCVGRECRHHHLSATLRISRIDITNPVR